MKNKPISVLQANIAARGMCEQLAKRIVEEERTLLQEIGQVLAENHDVILEKRAKIGKGKAQLEVLRCLIEDKLLELKTIDNIEMYFQEALDYIPCKDEVPMFVEVDSIRRKFSVLVSGEEVVWHPATTPLPSPVENSTLQIRFEFEDGSIREDSMHEYMGYYLGSKSMKKLDYQFTNFWFLTKDGRKVNIPEEGSIIQCQSNVKAHWTVINMISFRKQTPYSNGNYIPNNR